MQALDNRLLVTPWGFHFLRHSRLSIVGRAASLEPGLGSNPHSTFTSRKTWAVSLSFLHPSFLTCRTGMGPSGESGCGRARQKCWWTEDALRVTVPFLPHRPTFLLIPRAFLFVIWRRNGSSAAILDSLRV